MHKNRNSVIVFIQKSGQQFNSNACACQSRDKLIIDINKAC